MNRIHATLTNGALLLMAITFFITIGFVQILRYDTYTNQDVLGVSVDVPSTNYAIPSGAIFMAPDGNDANPGSQGSPVKTLSRAIQLSPSSGGTVVMRGGIYRDGRSSNVAKSITFQAYPGEKPWLDGTDVVTSWTDDGDGRWSVAWDTPTFCASKYNNFNGSNFDAGAGGPCHHPDMSQDPANPMAWDPQLVYKNENYIHQVSSRNEATGDAFYYDRTAKRIVLGFNPNGHTVELAARAQAIYIENGSPTGGGVKGIGFRRFATNEYNGNRTHGALLVNVSDYTLENSVFTQMAGAGASFANPKNAVIRGNYFVDNGFNGLDGNGKNALSGNTDNTLIEDNVFRNNNTEDFGTNCSASCASAGSKFAHMVGMTVKSNTFEDNNGAGFWCDLYCTNVNIINNVARNNTKSGLYYEVSNNGIIASNLVVGNSGEGIKSGSATTKIYNNTAVNNGVGFLIYDDSRAASGSEIAPDTVQVEFVNNVVYGGTNIIRVYNGQTNASQIFSAFNRNAYFRPNGSPSRFIEWRTGVSPTPTYNSVSAFTSATGHDSTSLDITSGSNPFFVNSTSDFRIKSDSAVFRAGASIPSDVASVLGVNTTNQDLGALQYPGVGPTIAAPAPAPPAPAPSPSPTPSSTPSNPSITSFTASPSSIEQGSRSTLNWQVANITACEIQTSGSSAVDVINVASWQTPTLTSIGSRIYTLVCTNSASATASSETTVTVSAPVTAPAKPTIGTTKSSVKLNEPFVVSWSSSGASSCTLYPTNTYATGSSGSKTITYISENTTYSVACQNEVGSTTSDSLTVSVDTSQSVTQSDLPVEEQMVIVLEDSDVVISNAAASETVTGETILDPTIITNKDKLASVVKIEYYLGETLIYTATEPPYTLDTTVLPNGTHTITARTYLQNGTTEEITRVLGVANEAQPATSNDAPKNDSALNVWQIVLVVTLFVVIFSSVALVFIARLNPGLFLQFRNYFYYLQQRIIEFSRRLRK